MNAIELKNVNFSYDGKTQILGNVNLTLSYGEVNLIAGHSGEGKSTLLYIISGIIPNITDGKLAGEVLINGENIQGKRLGEICRKVGVVLQNADEQIIQKTVEDEIAFGCENLAFSPEKIGRQIDTVCRLMNLDKSLQSRKLSGGQKQRLITASTLAMGQKIVILDEPLANLDTAGAEMLMSTLKSLAKAGYCIVVIEHRLDVVLPFVDKVFHVGGKRVREIKDKESYLKEQSVEISDSCAVFCGGQPVFSLSDVAFSVKDRVILNGVAFDILKGSRTVLFGENGCGKTTLLRLISRLEKPTRGVILQNISGKFGQKSKQSKKWYKKVGVVYQNPDYQLFMPTVEKEIKFGAKSDEYADEIAEKFGVKHLYVRHPQSLSEGQKRRVSIAAVVATAPEVLILDEPTNDLDIVTLGILEEYLRAFKGCVIVVSHDRYFVDKVADHLLVFCGGGEIKDFTGTYSEYVAWKREYEAARHAQEAQARPKPQAVRTQAAETAPRKLSYNEKRELEMLEREIPVLEAEKAALEESLSSGSLGVDELTAQSQRIVELIGLIDEKTMRWLLLSER